MRITILFLFCALLNKAVVGQAVQKIYKSNSQNSRLDTSLTNLKGKNVITIITNHTADMLKLKASVIYYLPVGEKEFPMVIPPGKAYTLKTVLYYPDFISINSLPLQIFNAPGKVVQCEILSVNPVKVTFKGDLSSENEYYEYYHRNEQSNTVYYKTGAQLNDFNKFGALADSINNINLAMLSHYNGLKPQFKVQEYWRVTYNNAFLKYHVLFDKEFKSGSKITVKPSYYDFENNVPLVNDKMVLSTPYLWFAIFRIRRQALIKNSDETKTTQSMLSVADSLYGISELGDVLKMRLLYDLYTQSKPEFETRFKLTDFVDPANKNIVDSVINEKNQLPVVGKKLAEFKLTNLKGDTVTIAQFINHPIIINFWASWCTPCIKEFPFENDLYKKYNPLNGLIVINICVDSKPEDWKQLSQKHNLQMINLYANAADYDYFKKYFNLYALPRSIFINKQMKVINNNFKRASLVNAADLNIE